MAVIWETVDRLGRPVMLTEAGWAHILFEYHDMVKFVNEIRLTVASADDIVHDRTYGHRDIHYRASGPESRWLRVVVHYRPEPTGWTGEVITAHFISRRNREEVPVWPSKNPHQSPRG